MQTAKEIKNLARQKHIRLYVNGQQVTSYRADATFEIGTKKILFESKGFETEAWRIKKKLIIALLPDLGFDEFWVWYNNKREVHK